jgi:spore coat polysaccharide biosynthesis predicted glycosyltransferase SpsG
MKAVIRTDTSLQIGTGYVMRCGALTLAEALKQQEAEVAFICREHKVIKQQLATLKKEGVLQRKRSTKAEYWVVTK